jgi:hypothetical protein
MKPSVSLQYLATIGADSEHSVPEILTLRRKTEPTIVKIERDRLLISPFTRKVGETGHLAISDI